MDNYVVDLDKQLLVYTEGRIREKNTTAHYRWESRFSASALLLSGALLLPLLASFRPRSTSQPHPRIFPARRRASRRNRVVVVRPTFL